MEQVRWGIGRLCGASEHYWISSEAEVPCFWTHSWSTWLYDKWHNDICQREHLQPQTSLRIWPNNFWSSTSVWAYQRRWITSSLDLLSERPNLWYIHQFFTRIVTCPPVVWIDLQLGWWCSKKLKTFYGATSSPPHYSPKSPKACQLLQPFFEWYRVNN